MNVEVMYYAKDFEAWLVHFAFVSLLRYTKDFETRLAHHYYGLELRSLEEMCKYGEVLKHLSQAYMW